MHITPNTNYGLRSPRTSNAITISSWSRGTNSRLPFCVNVNLNLSNKKKTPFKGVTAIMCMIELDMVRA